MTLFKQILIIISIFVVLLLSSVMVHNFNTANEFIQEQLYSSANDTATSLGLSITNVEDHASVEVMINAIFDSGYYELISFTDNAGNIVYKREQTVTVKDLPKWFLTYVDLKSPEATSKMTKNWMPYGEIHVRSNSGHAYYQLWQTLIGIVQTFIILTLIALFSIFTLLKIVLNSLKTVQKQAALVMNNDFFISKDIPFTTEFRDVVSGMNGLVTKIQDIFAQEAKTARINHELLYKDRESGLKNREFFNLKLKNYLESDNRFSYGFLMLINLDHLKSVANSFGHEALTSLLHTVSHVISEITAGNPYHIGCRIRENEFSIILPSLTEEEALTYAKNICLSFKNSADSIFLKGSDCHFNIALTPYYPHEKIKELLSLADYTLMTSLAKQKSNIEIYHKSSTKHNLIMGHDEWAKEIKSALYEQRFICALQPAMSDDRNILHYELLLRLNHLGTIIDANYFMPVILHFKWMDKIDKYVISHLIACGQEVPIAVNLSLSFIQQNANLKWLKEQLRDFKQNKSAPICFEISNNSIIQDTDSCIELSNMLQAFGYNIGVDHFMVSSHNLSYLQTIKPKYIKIDAQYLISLLKGSSEELPNRSLITLTELLNIMIIAIGVDSKELLDELKTLHINYFQGNYIAKSKLHQVT